MKMFAYLAVVLSLVVVTGCGGVADAPDMVSAKGTVLYNGKPVSGANVTFIVEGAPIAIGSTDAEGAFSLTTGGRPGAPLGDAKVSISKTEETASPGGGGDMTPQDMANMAAAGKMDAAPRKPEIPLKYSDPNNSELVALLDADGTKNVFEFRLVD